MTESRDDTFGPPGDHDRPYAFGDWESLRVRFTFDEVRALARVRGEVQRRLRGAQIGGPGDGDLAADG